jgi:ferredoxin
MNDNNEFLYSSPAFYAWFMANPLDRNPNNAPGRFYVDDTCIDCDMCREYAPDFFRRDEDRSQSMVYRQPNTPEEIASAEEAMKECPTDSIGNDGIPNAIPENVAHS